MPSTVVLSHRTSWHNAEPEGVIITENVRCRWDTKIVIFEPHLAILGTIRDTRSNSRSLFYKPLKMLDEFPLIQFKGFLHALFICTSINYRKQIARQLRTQYVEGIYRPKYYIVTLKCKLSHSRSLETQPLDRSYTTDD